MVDARRQEQPVLTIKPLLVRGIPPWLAMTGHKVDGVVDPGNATTRFDPADALLKQALALACSNNRQTIGLRNGPVVRHDLLEPTFPHLEIVRSCRLDCMRRGGDRRGFVAYQAQQGLGERRRQLREVDTLQTVAV